ncbi:MAG: hypothetical protein EAX86_01785 [Candidatus Heimdallarchaeota archaeon]|nr:hypothetical protein [Candidatus Heimdallarchaeota archaeon]
MTLQESVFSSIMFCYFLDCGPSSIDHFFLNEIKENPDLTAVRLMTKSTALVKGDSNQKIEQSIISQLCGPDIYPVDTSYRMVWYNWLIANRFSNDPRIRRTGAVGGIYCIYMKKNEAIIRNSLEIIETVIRDTSSELKSIDDIIKRQFNHTLSTNIGEKQFLEFIGKKTSDIITKQLNMTLNEKIHEFSSQITRERMSQTEKFKIILQDMVFKKGTPDEIIEPADKRIHWNSIIKKLDKIILNRIPELVKKKADPKKLRELYELLLEEKIWIALPLNEQNLIIQTKDIADFFFYYWLAHHQLLKKNKIVQLYVQVTNLSKLTS